MNLHYVDRDLQLTLVLCSFHSSITLFHHIFGKDHFQASDLFRHNSALIRDKMQNVVPKDRIICYFCLSNDSLTVSYVKFQKPISHITLEKPSLFLLIYVTVQQMATSINQFKFQFVT